MSLGFILTKWWKPKTKPHVTTDAYYICLLSDAYYQMSTIRCLLSNVYHQMTTIRCQISDAYYQILLLDAYHHIPIIRWLLSDTYYQIPTIRGTLSGISTIRCLLLTETWAYYFCHTRPNLELNLGWVPACKSQFASWATKWHDYIRGTTPTHPPEV